MPDTAFLNTALRIAGALCRDAVWDRDRCTWLGWAALPSGQAVQYTWRAQGSGLYEGTAGVALFLSQAHRFAPDPILKATALGALNCALSRRDNLPVELRPSLFHGWAGIAHACLVSARALDEPDLFDRGIELLSALKEIAPSDQWLDLTNGSAGAIQALLHAARAFGQTQLVDIAVTHGSHLLRTARADGHGASWRSEGDQHLLGYAHGSAGVACALLELAAATGDASYRNMALEAFRFERLHFDSQHRAWPDLRSSEADLPRVFSDGWCHGAPGVGFSRLRAYELGMSGDELSMEIDAAVQRTAASLHAAEVSTDTMSFSLCHGIAGNAAFLLETAQALGRHDLRLIAESAGRTGMARHEFAGQPWPCGAGTARETPGLMLGLAGIGLFFLQLYDALSVPGVLLICDRTAVRHSTVAT